MLIEAAGERTEPEARQMEFFPNKITYALSQIIKKKLGWWKYFVLRLQTKVELRFFLSDLQKLQFSSTLRHEPLRSCRSGVNDAARRSKFIANALKFDTTATAQQRLSEPTKKARKLWHLQHSRLIKCHANEGCETEGGEAAAKL